MERDQPSISPELATGEILDTYAIEALLGRTDGCLEYRARERAGGRVVRIKEYYPSQIAIRAGKAVIPAKDANAGEFDYGLHRFVQAGQASTRLKHDNLLRFVRLLELNGTAYQILEMPAGVPFEEWLSELGGKTDQDTLDTIARQLCDVLGTLHAAEQLHLNICPGTIYVEPQTLKLTLLESYASIRGFSPREASYWHGYLPPESVSDQRRRLETVAADIYSAGAVLLRAATGEPPPTLAARSTADGVAAALAALEGTFRPSFLRAVGQALALPVTERPANVKDWRTALVPPTARRSHGTRFKTLDAPASAPVSIAAPAPTAWGSVSLAAASSLACTLFGLALASEIRDPVTPKNSAHAIVAIRRAPAPKAEPPKPAVAALPPKAEPPTAKPQETPKAAPIPEKQPEKVPDRPAEKPKEVTPPTPPPVAARPAPEPPPKSDPVPKATPPIAEPKPAPEPKIALPSPPLPEPKIAAPSPPPPEPKIAQPTPPVPEPKIALPMPAPIPLPSFLRKTNLGIEDTVVRVPAQGKPTGEGALNGSWLALSARGATPAIQLFKLENGGFTGTPPPIALTPPFQVARMTIDSRNASEILVAGPGGALSALDRSNGRWQTITPDAGTTKRILTMSYDSTQETFAIISMLRKTNNGAITYSTIFEHFSAVKRKGTSKVLVPDGSLPQAGAISQRHTAIALRGQGIQVFENGSDRRVLDHRSTETIGALEFSQDGTHLAAGGEPAHLYLWQLRDSSFGEAKKLAIPIDTEQTGRDPPLVRALTFSADHAMIAAGMSDGTILVWNAREPKAPLLTYQPPSPADVLTWLNFVPNGNTRHLLLFPANDGAVRSFAVDSSARP